MKPVTPSFSRQARRPPARRLVCFDDQLFISPKQHTIQGFRFRCSEIAAAAAAATYDVQVRRGLDAFRQEVEDGVFPQAQHSPYKMPAGEEDAFQQLLAKVHTYIVVAGNSIACGKSRRDMYLLGYLLHTIFSSESRRSCHPSRSDWWRRREGVVV